jgi:hypothetical protein
MTTPPIPGMPVPREAAGGLLLSRYQNAQQSIATRAALAVVNLWSRYIHPAHFADTWANLNPLIQGVVATHYQASAANASQFYGHARVTAGYPSIHVPGVELRPEELIRVVNSMGAGSFFHFLKETEAPQASDMARDALRGASTRLVLNGGRETIVRAAGADGAAAGWERVIEAGACGFCSMLAGRGGVYSAATAGFRAHDHCHCVGRPVFRGQKSVNAELSRAWGEVTNGTRGAAARTAWDQYWSSHGEHRGTETATGPGAGSASVAAQSVGRSALPD